MTGRELYEIWAPEGSIWTPWAKPVLFAELGTVTMPPALPPVPEIEPEAVAGVSDLASSTAVVVELPALQSVEAGIALAVNGYRPVPLFNGAPHPAAAIDVRPALRRLEDVADRLAVLGLRPEAPPAFLLDSERMAPKSKVAPGMFDNRWLTFPQDFPSASFLLSQRIRRVVVLSKEGYGTFADDLSHVLLRYQEAGLPILAAPLGGTPTAATVNRPSRFRQLWYRSLALAGLKRNSAGGFGAVIPIAAATGASAGGFG